MTPEANEERNRELARLTNRWGEWYRLWFNRGLWWAEHDGDKLCGDSPRALESVLCDHVLLYRDRAGRRCC